MAQHSPSYSITMRLQYVDKPGQLGRITSAIGNADGLIGAVDIVNVRRDQIVRDITVSAKDVTHADRIVDSVKAIGNVEVVSVSDRTFLLHLGGKIEIRSKTAIKTRDDLSMAYTPGVGRVCQAIHADPESSFALTIRRNTVAVISDGSAVLGLGNIGARAAMPVMEGKAMLFKEFGDVDAFPVCLDTQDVDEIVRTCICIAPSFGGINCTKSYGGPDQNSVPGGRNRGSVGSGTTRVGQSRPSPSRSSPINLTTGWSPSPV